MQLFKKYQNLWLAFATGLLLFAAWPVSPFTLLIFVAWIPLLWMETQVQSRWQFSGLTYLTMFIWNVSTTWWIWNASAPGAVAAFLANSLLMSFPWIGYTIVKKWKGETIGYIALISFWMCFEYIHLHDWGLSWPWLTLGNAFATHPEWIKWYSFTGTSGGTLWVLLVNIFLFLHLKNNAGSQYIKTYKHLSFGIAALILPVVISLLVFSQKGNKRTIRRDNVVIVQPNIDPYEKVSDVAGSFEAQLQKLIATSEKQVDEHTSLLVWPETALYMGNGLSEEELEKKENYFLNPLWEFLRRHPNMSLFTGIESFRMVNKPTKAAHEFNGMYFESYNGAGVLDSAGAHSFYHKSMLVPGVETLPWFLKFIDNWFAKFGGTTAGYTRQENRSVLPAKAGYVIAPSICYESIYGEFMSRYVRNGANIICIITNDGWWKNTPGHKQHMNYARLRAIETGTWVVRSANTGISCFISPDGVVINPQPYDTQAAIKFVVPAAASKTFYVRYGDVLSPVMCGIALLLLLWIIGLKIQNRFFSKKIS